MELGKVWRKIAEGQRLTVEEKQFLELEGRNTQLRNSFVAGQTNAQSTLDIKFPFFPFYSEKLQQNTTSITIPIPSGYNHLFIMGSGRSTDAVVDTVALRFNGDTGNNYSTELMQRADTTQSGGQNLSTSSAGLGSFVEVGGSAGVAASFFAVIPNYNSSFMKTVMAFSNYRNASFRYAIMRTSFWDNTTPIEKLTFFALSGSDIEAGALFSVYGVI